MASPAGLVPPDPANSMSPGSWRGGRVSQTDTVKHTLQPMTREGCMRSMHSMQLHCEAYPPAHDSGGLHEIILNATSRDQKQTYLPVPPA